MEIQSLLNLATQKRASDLHLIASCPPLLRIDGILKPIDNIPLLTTEDLNEVFDKLTTPQQREAFKQQLELDFAYTLPEVGRFRVNASVQKGTISLAIRLLPPTIPTIDELGLPQICKELVLRPRGLVVVTGPTGSGKSTTLAAMIQYLNTNEYRHIVTIEDPVEYVYPNLKCAISQRELGNDTLSFAQALKHILRQDPDVILVGEMRDVETVAAVLTVAETGHLVLSTGHAPSAAQSIERIINLFPPHERYLAQDRLASIILGVLCQTLVPRASGSGRVAAVEIMLGLPAVKNLIREGKIHQLPNVIQTHTQKGMQTLDQALVALYLQGIIDRKNLLAYCNDPEEIKKLVDKVQIKALSTSFQNLVVPLY